MISLRVRGSHIERTDAYCRTCISVCADPRVAVSQLACDTIDTFLRGIVDTRMAIEDEAMNCELLDMSFARNSGTTVIYPDTNISIANTDTHCKPTKAGKVAVIIHLTARARGAAFTTDEGATACICIRWELR